MNSEKTALVTGASSGIGRAIATALKTQGYRVIGTSRNPDSMPQSARLEGVSYLPLDLTDTASVEACAASCGQVDILVNNAGESQAGALEELPDEALRRLFELNVLGPIRLTQLLLGPMRERGYGRVVMIGSMMASFPLAYRSSYGSTKAALKAFADGCRLELSPYGVWFTTIEPGAINTGINERRTRYVNEGSPYAAELDTVVQALDDNCDDGISPEQVAATTVKAIQAKKPKPLYAVGSNAPLAFTFKRIAPGGLFERVIAKQHGLKR